MIERTKKREQRHEMATGLLGLSSRAMVLAAGLGAFAFSVAVSGQTVADREQAQFIHDRLTGTQATDAMLDLMAAAIDAGDPARAARLAIDGNEAQSAGNADYGSTIAPSSGFYNAVLKSWASPWTNEEQDVFQPLNDYSATVIGMVRDAKPFTGILSDNIIYIGANSTGVSTYSATNNNHYEELAAISESLGDPGVLVERTQSAVTGIPAAGVAGVMTTRAAARAYFIDGTNRAMFRFTVLNHLCDDLESYKDNALPSDRIRQDVSRSPGGDSSIFLNECSACHTGMDGMAGAFAYHQYDYPTEEEAPGASEEERKEMGRMIYTPGTVQEKHLINSGNFRDGYVTTSDQWVNYWRMGENARKIGWLNNPPTTSSLDEVVEGNGAASLGVELANTEAFASCQVKKTFATVCLREPQADESTEFESIVTSFKAGYDMKQVFIDVAVHCSQHLNP